MDEPCDLVLIKIPKTTALLKQPIIDFAALSTRYADLFCCGKMLAIQNPPWLYLKKYSRPLPHDFFSQKESSGCDFSCQPTGKIKSYVTLPHSVC